MRKLQVRNYSQFEDISLDLRLVRKTLASIKNSAGKREKFVANVKLIENTNLVVENIQSWLVTYGSLDQTDNIDKLKSDIINLESILSKNADNWVAKSPKIKKEANYFKIVLDEKMSGLFDKSDYRLTAFPVDAAIKTVFKARYSGVKDDSGYNYTNINVIFDPETYGVTVSPFSLSSVTNQKQLANKEEAVSFAINKIANMDIRIIGPK